MLAGAAPAGAATIVEEPERNPCLPGDKFCSPGPRVIAYVAAAGEENVLRTTSAPGMGVEFHDAVAITAVPSVCALVDASTARCPSGFLFEVRLGDRDDVAGAVPSPIVSLHGGPGADVLTGAYLYGDDGDDALNAAPGPTGDPAVGPAFGTRPGYNQSLAAYLDGGPGADRLTADAVATAELEGGPGPDVLDAGAADAVADYETSPAGVRVALGGRGAGGDAEGDVLIGVDSSTAACSRTS